MTEIKITNDSNETVDGVEVPVVVHKVGSEATKAARKDGEWRDPDAWSSDHDLAREYGTETDGGM